jgi:hypothetical protein
VANVLQGSADSMLRSGQQVEYEIFHPPSSRETPVEQEIQGDTSQWMSPMYWAGFLVVGASTSFPQPKE